MAYFSRRCRGEGEEVGEGGWRSGLGGEQRGTKKGWLEETEEGRGQEVVGDMGISLWLIK